MPRHPVGVLVYYRLLSVPPVVVMCRRSAGERHQQEDETRSVVHRARRMLLARGDGIYKLSFDGICNGDCDDGLGRKNCVIPLSRGAARNEGDNLIGPPTRAAAIDVLQELTLVPTVHEQGLHKRSMPASLLNIGLSKSYQWKA